MNIDVGVYSFKSFFLFSLVLFASLLFSQFGCSSRGAIALNGSMSERAQFGLQFLLRLQARARTGGQSLNDDSCYRGLCLGRCMAWLARKQKDFFFSAFFPAYNLCFVFCVVFLTAGSSAT